VKRRSSIYKIERKIDVYILYLGESKMNKQSNMISSAELFFLLIGSIIGVGILSLPGGVTIISKQDGWISTLIGGIYPIYIVLVGTIIIKRYPESNILNLSRAFFGKIMGNFLNFLFIIEYIFLALTAISGSSHTFRAYSVYFMPQYKIALVFVVISIYISMKGLKVLTRLSTITFYLLCLVILTSLVTFKEATLLNMKPILGSGAQKILKGSISTVYSYANVEFLLLLYPHVKEKNKILKTSLASVFVVIAIYTFTVFISIYYAGPDLLVKQLWPFLLVTESVKIPVINNFRFIYIFIWIIMAFKLVAIDIYFTSKIYNNITKLNMELFSIFLGLIIFITTFFFPNDVVQRKIAGKIMPWVTLYNIAYITTIALFAFFKDKNTLIDKKGEKAINEKI
jgi:spore germination protein